MRKLNFLTNFISFFFQFVLKLLANTNFLSCSFFLKQLNLYQEDKIRAPTTSGTALDQNPAPEIPGIPLPLLQIGTTLDRRML